MALKLNKTIIETKDRRVILSSLWIFLMFNYLYTDVLTFMDAPILKQFMTGMVDGIQMTQEVLLGGAILMETAMAMIVLSLILKYKFNRWANTIVGIIHTASVFSSMFVGKPNPHYLFSGTIEIAVSSFVVWYAWTWPKQKT